MIQLREMTTSLDSILPQGSCITCLLNVELCNLLIMINFSLGFRDPAVTKAVVGQVQTLNPEFQAAQIRGKCFMLLTSQVIKRVQMFSFIFTAAAYTYYTSLSLENRLKKNGKHEERKCVRCRQPPGKALTGKMYRLILFVSVYRTTEQKISSPKLQFVPFKCPPPFITGRCSQLSILALMWPFFNQVFF